MNPQYMPQQGVPPQTFPPTRPSPTITPQSNFQNVPLGPQKSMFQTNGPMPSNFGLTNCPPNMNMPYGTNISSQTSPPFPNNFVTHPSSAKSIPTNVPPPINMVHPPSTNMNHMPPTNIGPLSTTNIGPPPTSNIAPPSSTNMVLPPTSNVVPPLSSNMGPPPTTNMRAPPSANMGHPPGANIGHPPTANMGPLPTSNMVVPPTTNLISSQENVGPSPAAVTKLNTQDPSSMDNTSLNQSSDVQSNQEPLQIHNSAQLGPSSQTISSAQLAPQQTNLKSQQSSGPLTSQDNSIDLPMANGSFNTRPSVINGANQPPQLKQQLPPMPGGQFQYHQQGMMNQSGRPPTNQFNQFPPAQQIPPNQFNQPPTPGQQQMPGQIPIAGPNPMFMPGQNAMLTQPPLPGQPPMFKQSPFPGQNNVPGMPMQGQPLQYNQPPLLAQNPNQLTNQMQNMSLNSPRQYPGIPQKSPTDNMASPQGYLNNQQMRMQQGYPPAPGQAPMQQQAGFQQSYQQQQRRLDPDQMPNPVSDIYISCVLLNFVIYIRFRFKSHKMTRVQGPAYFVLIKKD